MPQRLRPLFPGAKGQNRNAIALLPVYGEKVAAAG